jgi:hypothetical protein
MALVFALAATLAAGSLGYISAEVGMLINSNEHLLMLTIMAPGFLALVYGGADLLGRPLPVPTRRWLVPRSFLSLGEGLGGFVFGAVLGAGFLTVVPIVGFYVLLLWCLAKSDPTLAAAVMGVFGLSRAVPSLVVATYSAWLGEAYGQQFTNNAASRLTAIACRFAWLRTAFLLSVGYVLLAQAVGRPD